MAPPLAAGAPRRLILAVAISAIALDTALLGVIAPLLPEIERRTGAGETELGLALAAYAIPIALVSIPLGALADRIGRRPLLLGGLALVGIGAIVIAVSESLGPLIFGRAVQGLGSAGSWIAALALVSDLAPEGRKGEAIGYALAANSVGAIGGPALGGVAGDEISFAAPFLIAAGVSGVLIVAGFFLLPHQEPGARQRKAGSRILAVIGRRDVRAATGIAIGGAMVLAMIEVVVPLDLDERLGTSAAVIGLIFGATILVDAIAAPLGGRLGDRIGRPPVAVGGVATVALSAALLALLGGLGGVAVALAVYGAGISVAFAATVPWLDDAFGPLNRGLAYGGLNLIYAIGYSTGPLIAGGILEVASPKFAYWVIFAGAAVGTIAVARSMRAVRADPDRLL